MSAKVGSGNLIEFLDGEFVLVSLPMLALCSARTAGCAPPGAPRMQASDLSAR